MRPPKTKRKINMSKRDGDNHPDISEYRWYFVKYEGYWFYGQFEKQWYGWNFRWFGSPYAGLQLNGLQEVWEMEVKK